MVPKLSALQGLTLAIGVLSAVGHFIGIVIVSTSDFGIWSTLSLVGFAANVVLAVVMAIGAVTKRPVLIYPWLFFQLIFPTALLSYLATLRVDLVSMAFPLVFLAVTVLLLLVVAAFTVQLCHQDRADRLSTYHYEIDMTKYNQQPSSNS